MMYYEDFDVAVLSVWYHSLNNAFCRVHCHEIEERRPITLRFSFATYMVEGVRVAYHFYV
jgi:hypothetical protein